MQLMAKERVLMQCKKWNLLLNSDNHPTIQKSPLVTCLALELPENCTRIVFLADVLKGIKGAKARDNVTWLLWNTQWGIQVPEIETVGLQILSSLLKVTEGEFDLGNTPAVAFDDSETADLKAVLYLSMAFDWDFYFLTENAREFFFFKSHDGVLYFPSSDEAFSAEVFNRFQNAGLAPRHVEPPWYLVS